jgi:WD40 repeat protein
VTSVAFSPDGRRIVSGSWDKTVRIWDAETGAQVSAPLVGHSGSVTSVAFSPDGRRIVSGSYDETVRIWDAETGAQVSAPLVGHSDEVTSVAFSPDGRRIVSGSDDTTVRVSDLDVDPPVSKLPANISRLSQHMQSNGWVSLNHSPTLLWIPSEYRRPQIDDSLICISAKSAPSCILIDFSRFVHGTSWTLVAS